MNDIVYKKRKPMSEINVVPYIDVMLVLLIIFMVTAPLLQQGVDVTLPEANAKSLPDHKLEPVIVSVDKAGKYYLNIGEKPDNSLDADSLKRNISSVLKSKPGVSVLVKGDTQAGYGDVVTAMALLQDAGVQKVGLITSPRDKKRR